MEWVSIKSNYDEDGKRKSCNDNCVNGHYSTKKAAESVTFYILDAGPSEGLKIRECQ